MFKTIRVRLTLWYLALLLLTVAAFSAALYTLLARSLVQQVDAGLRLSAEQLAGGLNIENGQANFQSSQNDASDAATARGQGLVVQLLDAQGRVVDANGPAISLPVTPRVVTAAQNGQSSLETRAVDGHALRIYSRPIVESGHYYGVLQVAQSLDPVSNTLRQLLLALALIVPVALLSALAGGYWLARRALAPIDRITLAAQRISAEDLSQRLSLDRPDDEVGRLARTFDGMLARLDAAFHRQHQFTSDASHELRTPLTVMRGEIDVALSRPRRAEDYRRVLSTLSGEVEHMIALAEDLLTLARADERRLALRPGRLDVAECLDGVARQLQPLAQHAGLSLDLQVDAGLTIWADGASLQRIVTNLVSNAVKHTPPSGHITVAASRAGSQCTLAISDTGEGIAPEHLPHIFERFYRADVARSQSPAGVGLGLSIAQALVQVLGGTIGVESRLGEGTTVVVKLPAGTPSLKQY